MSREQLTQSEKDEIFNDAVDAFNQDLISELDFRITLRRIGYNAKDIEDLVKCYTPPPPENFLGEL